jgi:hypothetical protein
MPLTVAIPAVLVLLLALAPRAPAASLLRHHVLVTWYGNPRSVGMGILGEQEGGARAAGLRRQAEAYTHLTPKES